VLLALLCGFVYPDFQFDSLGSLRTDAAELLAVLPATTTAAAGRVHSGRIHSIARLDGRTPADVFSNTPICAIGAAKDEFWDSPDAAW